MFTDPKGPITSFEWGKFQINDKTHSADGVGVGKDICMINGVVSAWQARKGHRLKPHMVDSALVPGVSILVIGNGVNGRLRVTKKTRQRINLAGIEKLIIERTPTACGIYNNLARDGKQVALLAHGTC